MKPYNDYNSYLKKKYGVKVYRIGLDAGFTCPNRDGARGTGGCLYCNESGSRSPYTDPKDTLNRQLKSRIRYLRDRNKAQKFIAYFQAFTNTYASLPELKNAYDSIFAVDDIVGISIGTRPDTIDRDKLQLIASYKERYEVWVEYGLQSSHNRTLGLVKRGHTFEDFVDAVKLTKEFGIPISAHVIIGLPDETRDDIIQTSERLTELGIEGIKIHPLHILKGSALEAAYRDKKVPVMSEDEYVGLVCDFLEHLQAGVIIQRLTGQGTAKDHIAPAWALDKTGTLKKIETEFKKRASFQGSKAGSGPILPSYPSERHSSGL